MELRQPGHSGGSVIPECRTNFRMPGRKIPGLILIDQAQFLPNERQRAGDVIGLGKLTCTCLLPPISPTSTSSSPPRHTQQKTRRFADRVSIERAPRNQVWFPPTVPKKKRPLPHIAPRHRSRKSAARYTSGRWVTERSDKFTTAAEGRADR